MTEEVFVGNVQAGERVSINNPHSIPIKVIARIGDTCIEFGLAAGQFFTLVGGGVRIEFRAIDGSELEHPGPVGPEVVPGQPNRH